eukprot:m51a1_g12416 hypothetical protein (960) ;mRNA; f:734993-739255
MSNLGVSEHEPIGGVLSQSPPVAPGAVIDATPIRPRAGSEGTAGALIRTSVDTFQNADVIRARERINREAACADVRTMQFPWIDEYKATLSMSRGTAGERLERAVRLRDLHRRFNESASKLAKKLVCEIRLPSADRTLKPINAGGIAGGEKYAEDGIYMKFAKDWRGLYGGDQYSMKAAELEVLSMQEVLKLEISGLFTPLMTMIDYAGFRLIAMSLIPVDNTTLVYGSNDGAKTVINSCEEFTTLVKEAAERLNLKEHVVGPDGAYRIHTPADMEGHKGYDGCFYLVDSARLFPPEAPIRTSLFIPEDKDLPCQEKKLDAEAFDKQDKLEDYLRRVLGDDLRCYECGVGIMWYACSPDKNERASALCNRLITGNALLLRLNKASVLYNLLRPELVRSNPTPLCSDAWTKFQNADPNKDTHNREVGEATLRLLQEVIPNFAEALNNYTITPVSLEELTRLMHVHGINLRFLGRLRKAVVVPHIRSFLLTEMVARECKVCVRSRMRTMASAPEADLHREIVDYFNLLLGESKAGTHYWRVTLKTRVQLKYIDALSQDEAVPDHDLRDDVLLFYMFNRLCNKTGVKFKRGAQKRLFEYPFLFKTPNPLSYADLQEILVVYKNASLTTVDGFIDLIKESVHEEEQPTEQVLVRVGDQQIMASFKLMKQLKRHRRIEALVGADSAEAVASYFQSAERYLSSGNLSLALEAGIRGMSYGEVLFGPFSDVAVNGLIIVGRIFEKQGNYGQALENYIKALEGVQRLHKQHPLIGKLNAAIYFCCAAQSVPQQLAASVPASSPLSRVGGGDSAATFLQQAIEAYTAMYGHNAALLLIPLLGLEHNDQSFISAIQSTMQTLDSHSHSPMRIQQFWPHETLRKVKRPTGDDPQCYSEEDGMTGLIKLGNNMGIDDDVLKRGGVNNAERRAQILAALAVIRNALTPPKQQEQPAAASPSPSGAKTSNYYS